MQTICNHCGYTISKRELHVVGKNQYGELVYSCEDVISEQYEVME